MPKTQKSSNVVTPLHNQLATLERQLGPIEYRAPETLLCYDNNPRRHPEKQIVALQGAVSLMRTRLYQMHFRRRGQGPSLRSTATLPERQSVFP